MTSTRPPGRLSRSSLLGRPNSCDVWYVRLGRHEIGRVTRNDGWNAAVWRRVGVNRELESLPGVARFRDTAVADVVGAWLEENE